MNRLKNVEVLHVANLAKLELDEKEVEKFSYQLKSIMDEIDKIKDVVKDMGLAYNNDNIIVVNE